MFRPPEIVLAETAFLTPAQQAFRHAARRSLDLALPQAIWLDHHYAVLPVQRNKPIARSTQESWYDFTQVVKRGVNPRSRRRVVIFSGGSMSGAASKPRS